MKILFKQDPQLQKISLLEQIGIHNCHVKLVRPSLDSRSITPRPHHHTSCEIHLVSTGQQNYCSEEKYYTVDAGNAFILPPNISHRYLSSAPDTEKYSITFTATAEADHLVMHLCRSVRCIKLCADAQTAVRTLETEAENPKEYSAAVMECSIFHLLLALARSSGFHEEAKDEHTDEDSRVILARQYVQDNIDRPISCPELASYCHLSQKQLTRLFQLYTSQTPAAYIRSQKVLRIEQLLRESSYSLKEVSDLLHFASENHFNSFFTKYSGMTPGAFRKMSNRPTQ